MRTDRLQLSPPPGALSCRGFSLIELMLAITIFVLVVGAISACLITATKAMTSGQKSLEVYQGARGGMNLLVKDLRRSLSPLSVPYEEELDQESIEDPFYFENRPEEDKLQITFKGSSADVDYFIRQESTSDEGLSLDLRQVRFKLDEDQNVVREAYRSLLIARQEDQLRQRLMLRFGPEAFFGFNDTGGVLETPVRQTLVENVKGLKLEYSDGIEWSDSWDSETITVKDFALDVPDELLTEQDIELSGLPSLVKVAITLQSGVVMETITDIPASELNILRPAGPGQGVGGMLQSSIASERQGWDRARESGYSGSRRSRSRGSRRYVHPSNLDPTVRNSVAGLYGGVFSPSGGPSGGGYRPPTGGGGGGGNETSFRR